MPAPQPMQFTPLQYAQSPDIGAQLQGLGKNLGAAGKALMPTPAVPVDPGSAVPGAQGPTSVGGPSGPTPLVPPGTLPPNPGAGIGQAGNPAAGPVAPGTPPGVPPQQPGQNPLAGLMQSMSPPQLLSWLQNASRTGQPLAATLPGSAAMSGAGLLPTMNNPSQFGG